MKVKTYRVLTEAIESGIERGYRRAYKHTDQPTEQAIKDAIYTAVMDDICEYFSFNNDDDFIDTTNKGE